MSTIKERFNSKWSLDISTGCWLWTGFSDERGYGRLHLLGKDEFAHRIAYELYKGGVILKDHVLHKCDTPACVNPDHLFLGTQADNMKDMVRKSRSCKGEKNGMHKLTEGDVRSIRDMHRMHIEQKTLAKLYNVSSAAICNIVNNKSWRHLC